MSPYEEESARAIAALIETYRQGFLHLDPAQIESVWDPEHEPLVYVAQEKKEPTYGWKAIQSYYAALPDHIENILAKEVRDVHFTLNRQAQRAYQLHELTFRVSMIFQRSTVGWRAIHFHESALSAQAMAQTSPARSSS